MRPVARLVAHHVALHARHAACPAVPRFACHVVRPASTCHAVHLAVRRAVHVHVRVRVPAHHLMGMAMAMGARKNSSSDDDVFGCGLMCNQSFFCSSDDTVQYIGKRNGLQDDDDDY